MSQLSFFSAESVPPAVSDLAGLLAGAGQAVMSRRVADAARDRARISVIVDAQWRAAAVAELVETAGVTAEIGRSDEGNPLVRTDAVEALAPLAAQWTKGAVKSVPPGWLPGPRSLRAWALAYGYGENNGERFVLGLDPHAPQTHGVLAKVMMQVGIAPTLIGTRGPRPGLRISGRRRLTRLAENVGAPPPDSGVDLGWPGGAAGF